MSIITQNSTVTLHFSIQLKDGSIADSTYNMEKPAMFVMGDGSLSPNFEQCLLGMREGDKQAIELKADDAFGQPNPDAIHHMDRSKFVGEAAVEVGTIMAFTAMDGVEIPGIITTIEGESVTVDFNHPLAGQDVIFDVEILSVQ